MKPEILSLLNFQVCLKMPSLIVRDDTDHGQAAAKRFRGFDEFAEWFGTGGQSGRISERAEIAPVMRRGFIQRGSQIVAQRGGECGFVTGLHLHGIDQRREKIVALRTQQVGKRARLGGQFLHATFDLLQRLARFAFGALGLFERGARGFESGTQFSCGGARGFRRGFGGLRIRRIGGAFHCLIETRLRFAQLRSAGFDERRGDFALAFEAVLSRVPFREFGIEAFQRALAFGEGFGELDGARLCGLEIVLRPGLRCFQLACLGREAFQRGVRIGVERLLARDILFALADTLAHALRLFAGTLFLGVQRFAFDSKAVQGGGAFGFTLAQRRHGGRGFELERGRLRGQVRVGRDGCVRGGKRFFRQLGLRFGGEPA